MKRNTALRVLALLIVLLTGGGFFAVPSAGVPSAGAALALLAIGLLLSTVVVVLLGRVLVVIWGDPPGPRTLAVKRYYDAKRGL